MNNAEDLLQTEPPVSDDDAPLPGNALMTAILTISAVVGAIVAAQSIGWIHGPYGFFQFPAEISARFPPMGQPIPAEILALKERTLLELEYKNTVLSLSAIGAILTGFTAMALGIARRSLKLAVLGLIGGTVAGCALGAVAGLAEVFAGTTIKSGSQIDPTVWTIFTHMVGWVIVALGLGVAIRLFGQGESTATSILTAVFGGIIAAMLYAPLAGILFHAQKSEQYVPEGTANRIFWIVLLSLSFALATGWARQRAA